MPDIYTIYSDLYNALGRMAVLHREYGRRMEMFRLWWHSGES